MKILAESQD
jgi:hypothetical protein